MLLMDLWHRDARELANLVLNRYLDEADEAAGFPLHPLFMALRATVRAHVTAVHAVEAARDTEPAMTGEALAYFELALELLQPVAPIVVAIGGLSGSGKSSAAAAIAPALGPAPGARVVSSDRIRKELHGVAAEVLLPQAAYAPDIAEKVSTVLRSRVRQVVESGSVAIADAVFDSRRTGTRWNHLPRQRRLLRRLLAPRAA